MHFRFKFWNYNKNKPHTIKLGNKPFGVATQLNYTQYQGFYSTLALTPFSIESTGKNHLNANEFLFLNTLIGMNGIHNKLFVESFDFIKIKKFNTNTIAFEKGLQLSWDLQLGLEKLQEQGYDYFVKGSLGKSLKINPKTIFFAFTEVSLHSDKAIFRFLPKMGLRVDFGNLKSLYYLGYENNFEGYAAHLYTKIDISYSIKKDISLKLDYEENKDKKISFGLKFFF